LEDIDEIDFTHHLEIGAGLEDGPDSPEDTPMAEPEYEHLSARSESPGPGDIQDDSGDGPVRGNGEGVDLNQEDRNLLDDWVEQHRQDDDICSQIARLRRT
jgi:SIT4-associating protein SAP185/190